MVFLTIFWGNQLDFLKSSVRASELIIYY